jgi:hypothetical protein
MEKTRIVQQAGKAKGKRSRGIPRGNGGIKGRTLKGRGMYASEA